MPLQIDTDTLPSTSRSNINSPLASPTASTQTPAHLSSNTPRKTKLKFQVRSLKRNIEVKKKLREKIKSEKDELDCFKNYCDKFLNKPLAEIIKVQAMLKNKIPKARRYSQEYKNFALTLYFLGPKAYRFLEKILILPKKRTLELMTENVICKPGLDNEHIFKSLSIKIKTMSELDRHCTICLDETS